MYEYDMVYYYDQMIKADSDSWLIYEELFKNYVDDSYRYGRYDKNIIKKKILDNRIKWLSKQLFFFEAVKEILELFCQIEIGSECELNYDVIANYLMSEKFYSEFWSITEKEEIYKIVTDDIINGLPIWNFINMSDERRKIIVGNEAKKKEEEKNKYLCSSCEYNSCFYEAPSKYNFDEFTGFSNKYNCSKTNDTLREPKKECKNYVKKKIEYES